AETQARAVSDAGRHGYTHLMNGERFTGPAAFMARLRPGLASATTAPAGHADWYLDRHDKADASLTLRDRHLGRNQIVVDAFSEKRVPHPFHDPSDREKVDRDLVRKTFVRHQGLA